LDNRKINRGKCGKLKQKHEDNRRLKTEGYGNRVVFYNTIRRVGRIGYGVFTRYGERGNSKRGKCGEGKFNSIRGTLWTSAVDRTNVCQV
jgi:hypothetical protein